MSAEFSAAARRLGIVSAASAGILLVAYAVTLGIGLATLPSPDDPIGDPMFTILEILILVLMPVLVAVMTAVHAWAPPAAKAFSLAAVAFMTLVAGLTSVVHFVILTLSRQEAFAGQPWLPLVTSFTWPSVVYALDILAWDVFFALAMFFAAPVFTGNRLARSVRIAMATSGTLSLAGLAGVVNGDMQLRNVGIVGYVGVFLVVTVLLALLFARTAPVEGGRR